MSDYQDLLFEIGTEELPPASLIRLSESLKSNIITELKAAGLSYDSTAVYATPRRIAFIAYRLLSQQKNRIIERKGPAIKAAYDESGSPSKAALGFAKSCGVQIEDLERISTDKGEWLSFKSEIEGKNTVELIPDILNNSISSLPIAKKMRWGDGDVEFVRPVHWALLTYGNQVIKSEILGIQTSCFTYGHRFHAPDKLEIVDCADYEKVLETKGYVIPDFAKRKNQIKELVKQQAEKVNGIASINDDLLEEVTALNEWPVAIIGSFETRYLELPNEVLITTMQVNQKYFPVFSKEGKLLPNFITICNIESSNMDAVINGNERVVKPRLADAEFFWNQDQQTTLKVKSNRLKDVIFQHQLGSVAEKNQRVQIVAQLICESLKVPCDDVVKASEIAKSDLVTEMVGEFPSLQGVMGKYYALLEGQKENIALALEEQYFPKQSGGQLPSLLEGQILALADKLDTLTGIFSVGLLPTGDKDPYGLRRATISILRIIIECNLDLNLKDLVGHSLKQYTHQFDFDRTNSLLMNYINDRLKGICLDSGYSADEFESVVALNITQPVDFMVRMKAVKAFKHLPQSEGLTGANKRIRNILKKSSLHSNRDFENLIVEEELQLLKAATEMSKQVSPLIDMRDYSSALSKLAELGTDVDAFFDNVMVMVDDEQLKASRLGLLQMISEQFFKIADVSKLQH